MVYKGGGWETFLVGEGHKKWTSVKNGNICVNANNSTKKIALLSKLSPLYAKKFTQRIKV